MFRSHVSGIDCLINVLDYEPYQNHGHIAEGGQGSWEVLDLKGRPDHDLVNLLTQRDIDRIDREVFDFMEGDD